MKLYGLPGACSLASHIILHELDVPFTYVRVDPASKLTEDGLDFRTLSLNGYVPALVLPDGQALTENAAILTWLGDLRPEAALTPPQGDFSRARLAEVLSFLSSELHKAFAPFFAAKPLEGTDRDLALTRLHGRLGHVERLLAGGRTGLVGPGFSVADAYGFVMLAWTVHLGIALDPWPHTAAFHGRIATRPSVRQAMEAEGLTPATEAA